MLHPHAEKTPVPLEYSGRCRRWPWKPYLLALLTPPTIYLLLYVVLRLTGVLYLYYSQGTWEINGGTRIYAVDVFFVPLALLEGDLQTWLQWWPEPAGG